MNLIQHAEPNTTQIWRSGEYLHLGNLPAHALISLYSPDGRCLYRGPAAAQMSAPAKSGMIYWEIISAGGRQVGKLAGE